MKELSGSMIKALLFLQLGLASVESQHMKTRYSLILQTYGDVLINCNICTAQRVFKLSDNLTTTSIRTRNM